MFHLVNVLKTLNCIFSNGEFYGLCIIPQWFFSSYKDFHISEMAIYIIYVCVCIFIYVYIYSNIYIWKFFLSSLTMEYSTLCLWKYHQTSCCRLIFWNVFVQWSVHQCPNNRKKCRQRPTLRLKMVNHDLATREEDSDSVLDIVYKNRENGNMLLRQTPSIHMMKSIKCLRTV